MCVCETEREYHDQMKIFNPNITLKSPYINPNRLKCALFPMVSSSSSFFFTQSPFDYRDTTSDYTMTDHTVPLRVRTIGSHVGRQRLKNVSLELKAAAPPFFQSPLPILITAASCRTAFVPRLTDRFLRLEDLNPRSCRQ